MTSHAIKTFDLFDTLVARRCSTPHDIFRDVEAKSASIGFAEKRIEAERNIFSRSYTLDDIYCELLRTGALTVTQCESIKALELTCEWESYIPVFDNCRLVRPGDIIVSDMYLPYEFVRKIITEICKLPFNSLILSSHGKRNGTVWQTIKDHFIVREHLGDNDFTDIRSAEENGIPALLTTITRPTIAESEIADAGFSGLSQLMRETRLGMSARSESAREARLFQSQGNFPFLFLSSLMLIKQSRLRGWKTILFSSRDCFLWMNLFSRIDRRLGCEFDTHYIFTSRVAKSKASVDYKRYVASIAKGGCAVLVDLCGTGWSSRRLMQSTSGLSLDMFLIHHMNAPHLLRDYNTIGTLTNEYPINSLTSGDFDNVVLELLNLADHAMVEDVVQIAGEFVPVFSEINYSDHGLELIERHHSAFMHAVSLLDKIPQSELQRMYDHANVGIIESMYARFSEYRSPLQTLHHHQGEEEREVWKLLRS